ncbi:acyl-CoA dehydrogenase family protein [Actinomadura napierensis]|uniref:Acyl-CoA dehydrogenase family protein n=1 Tax=Actinomadura napierensis TaxID=267854 RepID=A0ABN2ZSI4_9ACTN
MRTALTDTDLTEDEALLAESVRAYFDDFVDNTYLNRQEESDDGYDQGRWKQLRDLGWTGVNLPERVGGGGGTLADAGIVARECGRAAFASPALQTARTAVALLGLDQGDRFDDVLARVAQGAPAALVAPPERTLHAVAAGGGYRISGEPTIVEWLDQSEDVVLLMPLLEAGTWLCAVVDRGCLDGRSTSVPSIDNERMARLDLDGFEFAPGSARFIEVPSAAAENALARANLLRASSMVGGCEAVLERTVSYSLERAQFGQVIGAFQAVRHHVARIAIAADAARLACNEALARADMGEDTTAIGAVALFAAGRSYTSAVLTAAQVHGGVGTTIEHVLHHHFRRAKAMQLRSGKPAARLREIHRALVVRHEGSLW